MDGLKGVQEPRAGAQMPTIQVRLNSLYMEKKMLATKVNTCNIKQ